MGIFQFATESQKEKIIANFIRWCQHGGFIDQSAYRNSSLEHVCKYATALQLDKIISEMIPLLQNQKHQIQNVAVHVLSDVFAHTDLAGKEKVITSLNSFLSNNDQFYKNEELLKALIPLLNDTSIPLVNQNQKEKIIEHMLLLWEKDNYPSVCVQVALFQNARLEQQKAVIHNILLVSNRIANNYFLKNAMLSIFEKATPELKEEIIETAIISLRNPPSNYEKSIIIAFPLLQNATPKQKEEITAIFIEKTKNKQDQLYWAKDYYEKIRNFNFEVGINHILTKYGAYISLSIDNLVGSCSQNEASKTLDTGSQRLKFFIPNETNSNNNEDSDYVILPAFPGLSMGSDTEES